MSFEKGPTHVLIQGEGLELVQNRNTFFSVITLLRFSNRDSEEALEPL